MIIRTMFAVRDKKTVQFIRDVMKESSFKFKIVGKEGCDMESVKRNLGFGVDLIFVDMDIAGGGIDATTQIKKMSPNTQVVLMTNYDNYDLIRQAFVRGAKDCLLTSASFSIIEKSLNRICNELTAERQDADKILIDKEKYIVLSKLARSSLVYALSFRGKENQLLLNQYKKMFGLDSKAYIFNVEFSSSIDFNDEMENEINNILYYCVSGKRKTAVGPVLFNRVMIIMSAENSKINTMDADAKEIADLIVENMKDDLDLDVKVGISNVHRIENMPVAFEEAIKSLRFERSQKAVNYNDIMNDDKAFDLGNINENVSKMITYLRNGNIEAVDQFSKTLFMLSGLNVESRKNKILEIMAYVVHFITEMGSSECDYFDFLELAKSLECVSESELNAWADTRMNYIVKSTRNIESERISAPIRNAKKYIAENYKEQISLADIAKEVGVTSQYFSKIFKDETGYNYVEWLNIIRIENAKKLMDEKKMPIAEIAYEVGYNDSNYFSRAFKKYVGVSPRTYSKNTHHSE